MPKHDFNIDHIAHLARIELSHVEKEKFAAELENILSFIDQLREVDTSDVEPVAHVSGLSDTVREDEIRDDWGMGVRDRLLAQAPKTENAYIKVKTVLEK